MSHLFWALASGTFAALNVACILHFDSPVLLDILNVIGAIASALLVRANVYNYYKDR